MKNDINNDTSIDIDSLREFFLNPEGWQYEYTISEGEYLFKQTNDPETYLVHFVPSDPSKKHDRPIILCTLKDISSLNGILNCPSPIKLDLGHLHIDDMSKEYFDFLEAVVLKGLSVLKGLV